MPADASSLRLIGMIPRPDDEYRAALFQSIESIKGAMTDRGIDPSRISAMPTRMWPVAQDSTGRAYALVSMCNQNSRPSAIPLSKLFPDDLSKPGSMPDAFIPVNSWESNHPASAGLPSEIPGVTAPIEGAMPMPPPEVSDTSSELAEGVVSGIASPGVPLSSENLSGLESISGSGELPKASEVKSDVSRKAPSSAEEETQQLIKGVLPSMKARGTVGEMGGVLLGIMAQQNPNTGRANFQKLMAEKATALQPGSSVYKRLQEALKSFDQIKDQL